MATIIRYPLEAFMDKILLDQNYIVENSNDIHLRLAMNKIWRILNDDSDISNTTKLRLTGNILLENIDIIIHNKDNDNRIKRGTKNIVSAYFAIVRETENSELLAIAKNIGKKAIPIQHICKN